MISVLKLYKDKKGLLLLLIKWTVNPRFLLQLQNKKVQLDICAKYFIM